MTGDADRVVRAILRGAGIDVAVGYLVFLVIALFVGLLGASGFMDVKVTLADLLSGDAAGAALGSGNSKGMMLVLLATASVTAPVLWKHRLAPLAFAVPLIATGLAFWPLYRQQQAEREAFDALGEFGLAADRLAQDLGATAGPLDALGIGAWLLFATVIFLALKGIARVLSRR